MFKRIALLSIFVVFLLSLYPPSSFSTIYVGDFGETGWQTWTMTFEQAFTGTAVIGVSNEGDEVNDSRLLIDNLVNFGPAGNRGFELGDFTGYTVSGAAAAAATVTTATSYGGTNYSPTEGSYMAQLVAEGADTSGLPGPGTPTQGAFLTFPIDVEEGMAISFDWNFLAFDYFSFEDFAFLYGLDEAGAMVGFEVLAQIGPSTVPGEVPEPISLILLGSGLAGAGLYRRFRKSK